MKKLKLMALELGASEVLTKEQLKHVLGGNGGSNDPWYCEVSCNCGDGPKTGAITCGGDQTCTTDDAGAYCSGGGYVNCEEICIY